MENALAFSDSRPAGSADASIITRAERDRSHRVEDLHRAATR
jgi:hypothetical protein